MAASDSWCRILKVPPAGTVRRSALAHILAAGAFLAIVVATGEALGLPRGFAVATLLVFGLLTAYVATFVGDHEPHVRFGAANELTLLRGTVACLLGGLAAVAPQAERQILWLATAAGVAALILDGLDGSIARRRGEASRFGASFDLETDALLIFLLSVLMYRLDRAGAWVLAIGLLRYAFVAAGWIWPRLAAPLRASFRRKAICVAQVIVLVACVPPLFPPDATRLALAAALAGLVASFAADMVSLLRRPDSAGQETALSRQIIPPQP